MTFSGAWDDIYRGSAHLSQWPWSDLVSYVKRYANPTSEYRRVLELGCGAGANIPFFLRNGFEYHAVEGSSAIVDSLHLSFPELGGRIVVGDFTQGLPFEGDFDLVVDRGSLTCNETSAIERALTSVFDRLRVGGKMIGIDWFSAKHPDAGSGRAVDQCTRTEIPTGHLAGTGTVHFSDLTHLLGLLEGAGFSVERMEHKQSEWFLPKAEKGLAVWNFVAVKP